MRNVVYRDNMTQTEVDLLMEQIDALETAYLEADLFDSLNHPEEQDDDFSEI